MIRGKVYYKDKLAGVKTDTNENKYLSSVLSRSRSLFSIVIPTLKKDTFLGDFLFTNDFIY